MNNIYPIDPGDVRFWRIMEFGTVALYEQIRIRSAENGCDKIEYRSHWNDEPWSSWGYWTTFPEGTSAVQIVQTLMAAGWVMEKRHAKA